MNELGLVAHLNNRDGGAGKTFGDRTSSRSRWVSVPGVMWYEFSYYDWGNFSVAICSDILDTFAWDYLRGRIQHLFVPAWNQDIGLFEQVTWTRGYEVYANVITVNHGEKGGSLVWTPKHRHEKEVFRVRGAEKGLAVTVDLPVKALIMAQRHRLEHAVGKASAFWNEEDAKNQENDRKKDCWTKFKTPPPNYPVWTPLPTEENTRPEC